MATLVLTAAGSLLGPVGGAVGALIGQAIDGRLLAGSRKGPRLQDLKVQTSSYGAAIPKLFGTMRVAGSVVWSTDLIEHRSKKSGGKGRPSITSYSYTASFAVLLSARPIRSVSRIWADGNLLRGSAGDWKSEMGFRLHLGGEDQAVDPFIASAEAAGTPAYRGCAYAVFENMALENFGNRIPSLTFEVEADAGPVGTSAVLAELSGGLIGGEAGTQLHGFAAVGDSMAGLIEALRPALGVELVDDGAMLRMVEPDAVATDIPLASLAEERTETLPGAGQVPAALTLTYYEPARDYQAGVQAARRPGGVATEQIEVAAALEAGAARAIADEALMRRAREQGRRRIRCDWAQLTLAPGRLVRLPGSADLWRVAERGVLRDGVQLELRRIHAASFASAVAEPGRSVPAPDHLHGPTVVHLLDLPNLDETAPDVPRLHIAAAGPSPGWRRAQLLVSLDDGASWTPIGATAAPAILGTTISALGSAPEDLLDLRNMVDVQLLHDEMALQDADAGRLLSGENLALIGDELVQFGRAEPISAGLWRLSRLLRGRRGSLPSAHAIGERFVLIEAETLLAYDPPKSAAGAQVRLLASGLGDAIPVETSVAAIGEALRPPSPAHLTARSRTDGGYDVRWVRRSRTGWAWIDGADAPLGETMERYRIRIVRADGSVQEHEADSPEFTYEAADLGADLTLGSVELHVQQVGSGAISRPALITITA
ncbi:hypothetical protein HJG53_06990 [Sphingomonas sp. ID1715]|uniref:GTA baseplate fiber-binding domain-containing protein n=1 Tax=Sphingomonas sp. ID1715 TaxID=1656898 RepID=UPI001487A2F1|nr:phage tail protein [Sphingomonas sp. ID1715]NNM76643.1 hypothetical protein [Sphingomonas sp. ID1715]